MPGIVQGELVSEALPGVVLQSGAQVTLTASTRAPLLAVSPASLAKQGLIVQAPSGNSGSIWIGDSTVDSTHGIELTAGQSVSINATDPSLVYAYATASGQRANFAWL